MYGLGVSIINNLLKGGCGFRGKHVSLWDLWKDVSWLVLAIKKSSGDSCTE